MPALLAALLGAGCADGWFYRPDERLVRAGCDLGLDVEQLEFAAADGNQLHGWWLAASAPARGTVVYCHGSKGNVSDHVAWVRWLPARGFHVLLFDYRGYGRSAGRPSRSGTIADAIAATDLALARDPQHTVLYGHSLGGAIAIQAAAARPQVRAVVAEGTFPAYRAAARARVGLLGYLLQFLVSAGHDPTDVLDQIPPRPLLVVHGARDRIVPLSLGKELYERAHPPKLLYVATTSGHRTPWVQEGARFEQFITSFFADAIRGAYRAAPGPKPGRL